MSDENDKKEKQQGYLKAFNNYFPSWDRDNGVIKKIKEDLERIQKITDLKEKYKETSFSWSWHHNVKTTVSGYYNAGDLHELVSHSETIEKYRKLIKELWDLQIEVAKQLKKEKSNNSLNNSNTNNSQRERERERESNSNKTQEQIPNQLLPKQTLLFQPFLSKTNLF